MPCKLAMPRSGSLWLLEATVAWRTVACNVSLLFSALYAKWRTVACPAPCRPPGPVLLQLRKAIFVRVLQTNLLRWRVTNSV
jgi:hypothetical protein